MGNTLGGWHFERLISELHRLMGPPMPDAACRGRAPLFDAEVDGEKPRPTPCPPGSRCLGLRWLPRP